MIRLLFLDLETSGIPQLDAYHKYYPYDNLSKYDNSRIVQIGLMIYEYDLTASGIASVKAQFGKKIAEHNYIIKPVGFSIKNDFVHKITEKIAQEKGIDLIQAFNNITNDINTCSVFIAHSVLFDKNILLSELYRAGHPLLDKIKSMKTLCTARSCADITRIRHQGMFKIPKLSELYYFLFRKHAINLHNAINDVKIMVDCFHELVRRNLFTINSLGVSKIVKSIPKKVDQMKSL